MTPFRANLKEVWSRLTWPDLVSAVVATAGLLASIFDLHGGLFSFLKYLAVLASVYLLFRLIGWWRNRLLWSLRNRLIVAYLFIAFVPILLIVALVPPQQAYRCLFVHRFCSNFIDRRAGSPCRTNPLFADGRVPAS